MKLRALMLFSLATLWVYWPVVSAELVYEDLVEPAAYLTPWQGWRTEVQPWTHLPKPRMLPTATIRLQKYFGAELGALHLGNVAIHLGNGILLLALLPYSWLAVFLTGLWWLHPLHTEAVCYLSARPDLLLTTAVLSLLLVIRRGWLGSPDLKLGALGLTLLTKEVAIVAPLLLAVRHGLKTWWPFIAAWTLFGGVVAFHEWPRLFLWVPDLPRGWWASLCLTAAAWWRMVSLLLWPVGRLTVDYDWDVVPGWVTVAALGTLLLTVAGSWRLPRLRFALLWMIAAILPRFLLPLPETLNDHQFHLAALGPFLMWMEA